MESPDTANTVMLVHIEHTKPISVRDFTATVEACGNLYADFLREKGFDYNTESSGLYVEKIEHNCIDIHLFELVQATMLPLFENMNTIFEFGKNLKSMVEYLTKGGKDEPKYSISQLRELKKLFDITANDQGGKTDVSVIDRNDPKVMFKDCNFTFNFNESNSAQNQIRNRIEKMKGAEPDTGIYKRVLMTVKQHRDDDSGKGNKAIIEEIRKKETNLLFETDELRQRILLSDENPVKRAYQVDVEVQTVNDKIVAYKVVDLHDIIEIDS